MCFDHGQSLANTGNMISRNCCQYLTQDNNEKCVNYRLIQKQSNRDYEEHLSKNEILRYAPVMPRIIRFLFIVPLQPEVPLWHRHPRTVGNHPAADLDYPLADAHLWIDRLHGDDDIVLLQAAEESIGKSIDYNNIPRTYCWLHRHPVRVAGGDEVLLDDVVGGYHGDDPHVGQQIFEHTLEIQLK